NSARSDKARLCDYLVGSTMLDVGPGGGVVLDLMAERFPDARVIGLDLSRAVVEALAQRKLVDHRRWEVVEGDAFGLETRFGARAIDSIVFCSILHEIYSYVPWDEHDGRGPRKFTLGSVRAIIGSAFRALAPGGRIVIRDGVMPAPGKRVLEFRDDAVANTFALYVRDFQGRKIAPEPAGPRRVRLSTADAHAFLYTFVWGPASFPYEVREQYGVETYERYADVLLEACNAADAPYAATRLPLPADIRSYLQRGYAEHLAPSVTVYEEDGKSLAPLPDSNALWVIEKSR
ncbi:MAG: methyltransferase, partial [Deltaproteobacteria bacterium]